MPNKAVSGWTQVPVTAAMLQSIRYDRLNPTGTQNNLTVTYEIQDSLGAVRQIATLSQQVASYPISVANILSSINTAQGT
jgi:hypothetical protein